MKDFRVYYRAPWGVRVWLITGICLVMQGVICTVIFLNEEVRAEAPFSPIVFVGLLILMNLTMIPFLVRGYEISADGLKIYRGGWVKRYSFFTLTSAWHDTHAVSWSMKIIGNDGYMAMHGSFRNRKLGKYHAFLTDGARAVVLEFADRKIVISPDSPEQFIESLEAVLHRSLRPRH